MSNLLEPLPWMTDAACLSHPEPDIWFPGDKQGPTAETAEAVNTCRECPVKESCLRYILDIEADAGHNGRYGIWAGFTPRDRVLIAKGVDVQPSVARNHNAKKTSCKHGHEFTPENTYFHPAKGERRCRQCVRDRYAARKRESA